jgi:hypothetical protein
MHARYRITLSSEESERLRDLTQAGKGPVRKLKRAQILFATAAGSSDESIVENVSVGTGTATERSAVSSRRVSSADRAAPLPPLLEPPRF